MDPSLQNDPDIAELEKAAANQRRKKFLIVVGVVLLIPLYWGMGFSSVRSLLERDGYTDLHVSASSLFDYGFEAKKGPATCKGTVTRLPFSTSTNSFCYSIDPSGRASGSLGTSSQ
jgi:hypothetical protein